MVKNPQTCLCKNCYQSLETFHEFHTFVATNYTESGPAAATVEAKEEKYHIPDLSTADLIVYDEEEKDVEMIKVEIIHDSEYTETEWIEEERESFKPPPLKRQKKIIPSLDTSRVLRQASVLDSADDQRIRETALMNCDICNELLDSLRDAKAHFKLAHGLEGYLICCERKFRQRCRLVEHVNTHYNYTYSCSICAKTFDSKSYLTKHLACHDDNKQFVS